MILIKREGSLIYDESAFHEEISKKMGFPLYYGKNLDALDECFSEFFHGPPFISLKSIYYKQKPRLNRTRWTTDSDLINRLRFIWVITLRHCHKRSPFLAGRSSIFLGNKKTPNSQKRRNKARYERYRELLES